MNQPIIRDVAEAVLKVRGKYGKDSTKTQYEIEQEATNEVLERYGIDETTRKMHKDLLKDPNAVLLHLGETFFGGELEAKLFNADEASLKAYQAKVWLAWQAFKPYADDLANLVKYSKVDTKKMGKSFIEERLYEKGMDSQKDPLNHIDDNDITKFFDGTFI